VELISAEVVPDDGQFHHVTATFDGNAPSGNMRLYLDGNPVGTADYAADLIPVASAPVIGRHADCGYFSSADMDEISFYGRALTPSEIQSIYTAGSAGKCASPPLLGCVSAPANLIAWWRAENNYQENVSGIGGPGQPYSFRIFAPAQITNALSYDAVNTGNIAAPGDVHYFTFTGSAGERLYYDALDGSPGSIYVRITDPSGNVIHGDADAVSDHGPFVLSVSGTYSFRMKGVGDLVGIYRFRLLNTANAPVATLDSVISNNIALPFGVGLYQLGGTANLRLFLDHLAPYTGEGYYRIYGANDQIAGAESWFG
jgi:hypothetical protein